MFQKQLNNFLMNGEVGHFMVRVINFERDRLPTRFKSGFQ